jgi:hypothetical protein
LLNCCEALALLFPAFAITDCFRRPASGTRRNRALEVLNDDDRNPKCQDLDYGRHQSIVASFGGYPQWSRNESHPRQAQAVQARRDDIVPGNSGDPFLGRPDIGQMLLEDLLDPLVTARVPV